MLDQLCKRKSGKLLIIVLLGRAAKDVRIVVAIVTAVVCTLVVTASMAAFTDTFAAVSAVVGAVFRITTVVHSTVRAVVEVVVVPLGCIAGLTRSAPSMTSLLVLAPFTLVLGVYRILIIRVIFVDVGTHPFLATVAAATSIVARADQMHSGVAVDARGSMRIPCQTKGLTDIWT